MPDFADYQLVIFDFHKTLTNSVYFDQFDPPTRNRISDLIFRPPNDERWDRRWMTGYLQYTDVLQYLSRETDKSFKDLEDGLLSGLGQISWNQSVWEFSRSVRTITRTAIATVNNDLFRRFVMPRYELSDRFDVITSSYEEHNYSKVDLCIAAAGKLGLKITGNRILLIDDKQQNIDDFVAAGGEGYLYRTDELFLEWLEGDET